MSEENHLLRIDHLSLQNFRCFAECELNLHPTLTVLVAENAQGKTALLDALSLALHVYVAMFWRGSSLRGFERSDIYLTRGDQNPVMQPRLPCRFSVDGEIDGEILTWSRALCKDSLRSRASTKNTKEIRRIAKRLADRSTAKRSVPIDLPTVLPVVAYYGTGRLYDERRFTEGKRWLAETSPGRFSAYLDCLAPSSSYKSFSAWFGQKWEQVSNPRFRAVGFEDRPENHITAVRDAVSTVLEPTGWTTIVWEPAISDVDGRIVRPGYIALEHPQKGRLPLTHLSDGVRNMVALVGDLAHRCISLNPFFGEEAAKRTSGIVLIDEVEMHLHPRWQQLVIGLLQCAFPKVQIVLTTHSPHVLSTVDAKSIRVIHAENGSGTTKEPASQTQGDESSAVLARVMDVNPAPTLESTKQLSRYRALIQSGDDQTGEAGEIWDALIQHFGAEHHLLQEAEVLRRLQEFKRQHHLPSGGQT